MSEWLPIESAPKDGTRFDVWINGRRVADAYYAWLGRGFKTEPRYLTLVCDYVDEGGAQLSEDLSGATHWMPLPAPPLTTASAEEKMG